LLFITIFGRSKNKLRLINDVYNSREQKIGVVQKIISEQSKIVLVWLDIPEFELTDIKWYSHTLEQITYNEDIDRIFGKAIKTFVTRDSLTLTVDMRVSV
jgi:hypothetical protein